MLSHSHTRHKNKLTDHLGIQKLKQIVQQLESFWQAADKIDHSHYFSQTHKLLYQLLNFIDCYKCTKPDWKSIYYQNLLASINSNCKAIAFYYFRLATKLSTHLSLTHLLDLLRQYRDQNLLTSQLSLNIDELKINYRISCKNQKQYQKYFHFLQKLTVKLCKFILDVKQDFNFQKLFVYYFSVIEYNNSQTIQRYRKIVTIAFGAYCTYFARKKIKLQLNVFQLMNRIVSLWQNQGEDIKDLYFCCKSYIYLIGSSQVVQFVSEYGTSLNIKQNMSGFIRFIVSKHEQSRNEFFQKLIEDVCLRLMQSKSTQYYFDFSKKTTQQANQNSYWALLMVIMKLHSQIKEFNTFKSFEFYSQWLISADSSIKKLKKQVNSQFYNKIISLFILEINKYAINEVRPIFQKYDPTNLLVYNKEDLNLCIKFLPLYRFMTYYLSPQNQKYTLLQSFYYKRIFTCLLCICLVQNNQNAQSTFLRFIIDEHTRVLANNHQKEDLVIILITLNRLASTKYCQLACRAIIAYVNSNVSFSILVNQPKALNIFTVLRRELRMKCEKCKEAICKDCKEYNLFTATISELLFKIVIKTFKLQRNQNLSDIQSKLLHQMIEVLIQNYYQIQDDSCTEIIQLLIKHTNKQQKLDYVLNIIKTYVINVSYNSFISSHDKKSSISNGITFYRSILSQKLQNKDYMSQLQKIQLIDFMANVKRILYSYIHVSQQKQRKELQQFESLIAQCQNIERVFLEQSPTEFIENLIQNLQRRSHIPFQILTSVCLKSIYYIIYPSKETIQPVKPQIYNNLESTASVEQIPPKNEFDFLHGQLQQMSIKLKMIKNKLKAMQIYFQHSGMKSETSILGACFKKYNIKVQNCNYIQHVIWQLNDLLYVAHLADLQSFKNILISLRLSLLQDHFTRQILFLQLAKLNLYEIISPQEQLSVQKVIQKQIKRLQQNECNIQYYFLLKLIAFGQSNDSYQGQFRILKIVYLIKNNPLFYVNNKKNIIVYLFTHINAQTQKQGEIKSESCLLRNSHILYRKLEFDLRHQSQILLNGWSCLQLLVLFSKKIFKKCLQLNELSKIGDLDKFSANLLIRSGNIAEMDTLFSILMLKHKKIQWLKVADSLREIVSTYICENDYKKIDRVLYPNRKSLLMSYKNAIKLIHSSFGRCGRIGMVLSEIFVLRIKKQFQADQWEYVTACYQMGIFNQKMSAKFKQQIEELIKQSDRNLDDEIAFDLQLTQRIATKIFQSYRQGIVFKDYIAKFVNEALEHPEALNSSQHQKLDSLISNIALIFEQFNYQIKEFWVRYPSTFNLQDSFITLNRNKVTILNDYTNMKRNYLVSIQNKKRQLQKCKHPVSFLFPLGKYMFNMAWKGGLLITYVSLPQFQDNFNKVQDIIKKYDQILMSKQKINPTTYKRRKELDKSMGFIVSSVDIGIVDQEEIDTSRLLPSYAHQINEICRTNKSLLKFLKIEREYCYKHLQLFAIRYEIKDLREIRQKLKRISEYLLKISTNQKSNVLLYLHSNYLPFPFQSIKYLQDKGIFRIPSVQYLLQNQHKKGQYRASELKYLINTIDDLQATEQRFQMIRRKYQQWIGLKKRKPMLPEFIHLLEKEIFLYMGHGTGTQHINLKELIDLKINCLMMVFGCSSAKMIFQHSQPQGWAYESLIRGCPGYLGCLWNVTDVDIDQVTTGIFNRQKAENLALAIGKQKQRCSYQYVNASSLVIYGLPSILIFK